MTENPERAAILIYTANPSDPNDYFLLLGSTGHVINTIGGRKQNGEPDLTCCVRECREETRHLIDFRSAKVLLKQAKSFKHQKCVYYIIQGDYDTMVQTCKQFLETKIEEDPNGYTNEMKELCLISINQMIKQFVMLDYVDKKTGLQFMPAFIDMFKEVGYDKIKGNTWNHNINTINMPVDLSVPLVDLPEIVSVSPLPTQLPVLYGKLYEDVDDERTYAVGRTLYMSEQFYYSDGNEHVYRQTIIRDGEIVFKRNNLEVLKAY